MRRSTRLLLVGLALVAACKGLLVDQGNDFPCDFTQPPQIRDAACAPGETCGVSNHCQRFVYEGPQFEGPPRFPTTEVGGKVHPLILDHPVQALALSPYDPTKVAVVMVDDDGHQHLYFIDVSADSFVSGGDLLDPAGAVEQLAMSTDGGVMLLYADAGATRATLLGGPCVSGLGSCLPGVRQLRSGNAVFGVLRNLGSFNTAGTVELDAGYTPFTLNNVDGGKEPDAGAFGPLVLDYHWAKLDSVFGLGNEEDGGAAQIPVAYALDGFWARLYHDDFDEADSGWVNLLADGESPELGGAPNFFRRVESANTWAIAYNFFVDGGAPSGNRLSTWLLGRQLGGSIPVAFARPWSDCTPCPKVNLPDGTFAFGAVVGVAPKHDGAPSVEVLCSTGGKLSLVDVVGATSAEVSQSCLTVPLQMPFVSSKLSLRSFNPYLSSPVQDLTTGFSVALGGQRGEVWDGFNFSTALPLFLERVPLATGVIDDGDAGLAAVAVTDEYLASQESNNGFKAFRVVDTAGDLIAPRSSVGGIAGWFVDATGRTLLLTPRPGKPPQLGYGPALLNAHGDPAREPFFGEAVVAIDQTVNSFVMAADDSLYLVPFPQPVSDPALSPGVLPVLAPEPNVPVRSFTLERTPIGTNGIDRVRGYLVTSRNVFEFELSGSPARWSSSLLPLSAGEPLEVWMDNPRGGLGRVGYRDGTVLTLPGGFLLAQANPPLQVLDYENYGGWPVAYAADGLYFAEWDYDGGLLNKTDAGVASLPMSWRRKTLPDGSEPWLVQTDAGPPARPAKLQVTQTIVYSFLDGTPVPTGYVPDAGEQLESQQGFHLLLYLDDAVYEVGQMTRFNSHQVQPD